jgi:uncharacterized membrane protein
MLIIANCAYFKYKQEKTTTTKEKMERTGIEENVLLILVIALFYLYLKGLGSYLLLLKLTQWIQESRQPINI